MLQTVRFRDKIAFTLAEVLITLGIIGVVAAMTLPTLVNKYQEKVLVSRLKQSYSIFSQAFMLAVVDNGPAAYWDIGEQNTLEGCEKLYNILSPYLVLGESCGKEYGCFADDYTTFSGNTYGYSPKNHSMYCRGVLINGTAFAFPSSGSGCSFNYDNNGIYKNVCAPLYMDLNSYKKPNRTGVDYFGFLITRDGVLPLGLPGDDGGLNGYTCKYQGTSRGNGTGCTAWVLNKQNMDYLKRDISDEWKWNW